MRGSRHGLLFAITGMRRGELAGLARPDLGLDAGLVRIDWTLGLIDAKPNRCPWAALGLNPSPPLKPSPCRWRSGRAPRTSAQYHRVGRYLCASAKHPGKMLPEHRNSVSRCPTVHSESRISPFAL